MGYIQNHAERIHYLNDLDKVSDRKRRHGIGH